MTGNPGGPMELAGSRSGWSPARGRRQGRPHRRPPADDDRSRTRLGRLRRRRPWPRSLARTPDPLLSLMPQSRGCVPSTPVPGQAAPPTGRGPASTPATPAPQRERARTRSSNRHVLGTGRRRGCLTIQIPRTAVRAWLEARREARHCPRPLGGPPPGSGSGSVGSPPPHLARGLHDRPSVIESLFLTVLSREFTLDA